MTFWNSTRCAAPSHIFEVGSDPKASSPLGNFMRSTLRKATCVLPGLVAWIGITVISCLGDDHERTVRGQIDARMMRQPDISARHIAFVYAGDIWVAPKEGGVATRLSSPRGEESFPKFSPDGSLIAFSANYDGNLDIYVVPTEGGLPRRITHHGAPDRLVGWYPDGKYLLFATSMTSYKDRFNQLYRVSVNGGLPEKLPVPYGEFGEIAPDGKTLAYTPVSTDFRTWKRYRGGMNPDIWLFDLEKLTARNLTKSPAAESVPMWYGNKLYFLSDGDENKRANIWLCNLNSGEFKQVTFFKQFDVHFPSIGPMDIVFECAGRLYLLDLRHNTYRPVEISVVTDRATLKPRIENVSGYIHHATISPSGKRALFEARGEVFSAPAENGVVRNLTRSPGVAERFPTWSPDGKWIAFFSDRTGEYELTLIPTTTVPGEKTGPVEQILTSLGPGFRYRPQWSPDSRKILWIDQAMRIWVHDLDTKTNKVIDQQLWMYHGDLNSFRASWSPDSRWIAYAGDLDNRHTCIVLYDYANHRRHQVTSGFYDDSQPVFDPEGKYLFFLTGRSFQPIYSDVDNSWIYANTTRIAAVPLRKDVPSPLAPRNDEEPEKKKTDEGKSTDKQPDKQNPDNTKEPHKPRSDKHDDSTTDPDQPQKDTADSTQKTQDKKTERDRKDDQKPKPVEIDLDDFEGRVVLLPPRAGRYANLCTVPGKIIYRVLPRTGSDGGPSPVEFYDLEKRETRRIVDDADDIELSANRDKLLVRKANAYHVIEPKEGQRLDKRIDTSTFEALIDPVAEWKQIFNDAWRFQRDYFYDPALHGVNWGEIRERYLRLLADAVTRWDVNYILGELIGELNSSHTYRGGGDTENPPTRGVGYLGCDFVFTNGAFQIAKILRGAPWDAEVRSPLLSPGITNVNEGDYLLAVNGEPIDTSEDPWAAFQGLADKPVLITVNSKPTFEGAREVLVHTLASEARLRNLAWINENRLRVEKLSDGKVGYVYVPDTGQNGQNELVRQWRAQISKPGLIIDERFNSGGQIPDRFVELLNRPLRNFWGVRDGRDWTWPPFAHFGPKAMLINGWSGSGGDCLPYYFKQSGLGPLIGLRTWGGLIGMTGVPQLIDGGTVTVPTFGIYSTNGQWIIEGYGVDPDIEVVDDPAAMARGEDPQLERAVKEVLKMLSENPPPQPRKPPYPKRDT
ncbi:MAG: PDZ domain-containing protein [Verrucomicrobiae bacterium]|nr:PDZ domain-containing protein [Verrucomicrobiae bacterium]